MTHTEQSFHIISLYISYRLLQLWTGDIKSYPRSWSNAQIVEISNLLLSVNETKPNDIHRSVRSLKRMKRWKGTEFRTVLLYVGIVLFKDYNNYLSADEYELFSNLFCATTICTTKAYQQYVPVVRNLLVEFNEMHISLYGDHSMTSNLHLLSHMIDDVEYLGDLSTMSSISNQTSYQTVRSAITTGCATSL